jgi:hypothetical protein
MAVQFKCRRATIGDDVAVASVFSPSLRLFTSLPMLHTVEEDRWFVENMILNGCEVTVAEDESGIVSFLARNGEAIRLLYTHPACIGSGAGTQLIEAATARGTAALELWCQPSPTEVLRSPRLSRGTLHKWREQRGENAGRSLPLGAWAGRHPLTFTASDGTMRLAKLALHASAVSHWRKQKPL